MEQYHVKSLVLTLTKLFVAAVLAVITAVASLEVIDAGSVAATSEFGALTNAAAMALIYGIGAIDDTVAAVSRGLAASIVAAERAFWGCSAAWINAQSKFGVKIARTNCSGFAALRRLPLNLRQQ